MDETKLISAGSITDFESIKDRICSRLINRKSISDLLCTIPHRNFHDLAIIYYLSHTDGKTETITNKLLKSWNTDKMSLYRHASKNSKHLHRGIVLTMFDVLESVTSGFPPQKCIMDAYDGFDVTRSRSDILPAYVATNITKTYGASIILYDGLLDAIAQKIGSFFAIPSSIHEFLLVPSKFGKLEELTEMVRDINATELHAEEVLSDNIYFYSAEDYKFKIIS